MWNNESAAVAAAHSVDPERWWREFGAVIDRVGSRFGRYEPLQHAAGLMLGMLSGLDRKNCWTIAEHRGDVTPDGLQHLLTRAQWDADAVRTDAVAPRAATMSAWSSPRTSAVTSWLCSCSSVRSCDPMNPVAPVSATFMARELRS